MYLCDYQLYMSFKQINRKGLDMYFKTTVRLNRV